MKESRLFKSLMATFIAIILSGPAVVLADTPNFFDEGAKTTVSYADLNIDSEEGVQELYKRLRNASRKVCNVTSPMSAGTTAWRTCNRATLSNAVDKFNSEHHECMHAKLVAKGI